MTRGLSLTRRGVLAGMASLPAATALTGRAAARGAALTIYSWPDYFAPLSLEGFRKQSGVQPVIATYESNDAMFARLNSPAGSGFDIAVPSQAWVPQLAKRGLIEPLDHSRLDFSVITPGLLNREFDPGNAYSIPKDYGFLGVLYDPEAVGMEIASWEDFFTAGAKPGVSGRVRMSGSGWETIGPELWLQGLDWNSATNAQIEAAGQRLIGFAKHIRSFSRLQAGDMANGTFVLATTDQGTARRAIAMKPGLKWVLPAPVTELWIDNYVIVKNAPNRDMAYAFLTYQLQPEVQVAATGYIGFPAPLEGLRGRLGTDLADADMIFGGSVIDFSKVSSFVVNPDTIGTYMRVQTEIQAAAAG